MQVMSQSENLGLALFCCSTMHQLSRTVGSKLV
jgi:hypothetical protein